MKPSSESSPNLIIRESLADLIIQILHQNQYTQTKAAKLLEVSQPRISDLMRKKVHLFSIDVLVNMLDKLGYTIHLNTQKDRLEVIIE